MHEIKCVVPSIDKNRANNKLKRIKYNKLFLAYTGFLLEFLKEYKCTIDNPFKYDKALSLAHYKQFNRWLAHKGYPNEHNYIEMALFYLGIDAKLNII